MRGFEIRMTSFKHSLDRIAQIAKQMKTVSDLNGVRSALRDPFNIMLPPIPCDDLYSRMCLQPLRHCCWFSIGQ